MLLAQLTSENRILIVFDTERHVDEGVTGVEISASDFAKVMESGRFGDWVYKGGAFIHDPEVLNTTPSPLSGIVSGEIPQAIL